MKATEASLRKFLKKSPQFVIPIYRRSSTASTGIPSSPQVLLLLSSVYSTLSENAKSRSQ